MLYPLSYGGERADSPHGERPYHGPQPASIDTLTEASAPTRTVGAS